MGAEGRYEDWVYLGMMEREWKRPVADDDRFSGFSRESAPSPRASIVLLFWSYFETRIESCCERVYTEKNIRQHVRDSLPNGTPGACLALLNK
jgi:hypothetical protein